MEDRPFHPLDYVSALRRRKWWLIVPLVLCTIGGALLAAFLPKTYMSEAEIGIAAPTLSPEILRGVSSLDSEERQRAISQQLLSRTVLERVVRDEKISPDKPVDDVVGWLRSRVIISVPQPIGRMENRNGLDSFRLGYTDGTPERTQRITNRLAYVFVEENSKTTTERAEKTSEVIGEQLRASEERLATLEAQLRAKKEANMGRLPDQVNTNVQLVNGLRQTLDSISLQLRGEQDRLSMVDSQIESMHQGAVGMGITTVGASAIQGTQMRIEQLRQQLAQARAKGYTDKHPEITTLQEEIAAANAELAAVRKQGTPNSKELLQADPRYQRLVQDRDNARARIRMLQQADAQTRGQIAQYQSRVDAAPMVEQDLAGVTRAHELEQERHKKLKGEHEAAVLAEDVARKQGGERFSVLYPAGLPGRPIKPNQLRVVLMSLLLGLGLGAALGVGRELLDRSVHDVRALQTEFEVPVLGEIPRIQGVVQS